MKNLYAVLVVTVLGFFSASAQVPKAMGVSDPEAKKILDAVSAKFKTFKTVQGKFSLKIDNSSGKTLGTKTGIVYMKGSRYRISVTGQEIYSDGSNVWTYDKSSKEVTISKIDPAANTITPQKLFTNFYDRDFLYKLNGTTKGLSEIELTPIDKSKPFYKILLYTNSKAITTTKLYEKNGNRYTYSTTSLIGNGNVPDATFVFDEKKYPGVEVVDLR